MLLDSNVEQESMVPSKGKNKSTETVPEKDVMADLLDKDLKILKDLKGDVEKIKKTMCDQNADINKEIENQNRSQIS